MSHDRWKQAERRIAAELGGARVPVTGRARGDAPDIAHERYSVEVKDRKAFPAWLHNAMAQAEAAATAGQIPLLVLHQRGQRYADAFAILRLRDLTEEGDQ